MRILVLDTSTPLSVVGAADEQTLKAQLSASADRKRARDLVPCMKRAAEQAGWRLRDVELVIAGNGPGSYTGLRVGLTAVKMLALASHAKVVTVDSLAAAALSAGEMGRIAVTADAQSQRTYAAEFDVTAEGDVRPLGPTRLQAGEEWLAGLAPGTVVTGPGLALWESRVPSGMRVVPAERRTPSLDALWQLGMKARAEGRFADIDEIAPQYLRPSAAEEKRKAASSTIAE
jgi:tRNA threonylcarbamoyladenosine biosynthesis protein TsaB